MRSTITYASGVERNVICSSEDVDHLAIIVIGYNYRLHEMV